ncbi:Zn-dependent hydrolase [Evansella tamaricis]|uniref:Zn-dependent hydrolase n=1 Tax=Evansella tamaricis TaxID=2069301 RepID=A0ABS6JI97_9BACI|nr:Zn-dependent hydrolase [Evansella tamaricis]MBU9713399.1 Zn-dependent hydrolase [Evansella tamaricis]
MKTNQEEDFCNHFYCRLTDSYNSKLSHSGVNGHRLANRLKELAKIGLVNDGGSNRMGFSKEELEAKAKVKQWMAKAGLVTREDGAGNVFGRLEGKDRNAPVVLAGSHVDSVPRGGHFDGPLGVLSALEVVESWKETGFQPNKSFEVVIFTDEEGSRFNSGLMGSSSMMGELEKEQYLDRKDVFGNRFSQVLTEYGLTVDSFFNNKYESEIAAFIEVHIEQGKQLEKENLPIGYVTGVAGPCWLELTFIGEAGHAGNTPMNDRSDALIGASEFICNVEKIPKEINTTAVATVGKLMVHPNGINVIPGKVELTVDIRDINEDSRNRLVMKVKELAQKIANERELELELNEKIRIKPIPVLEDMQQLAINAIRDTGIKPYPIPSGAGHDAMILGKYVPMAMLFVRSLNGVSHNPMEWTTLDDCVKSVHVLKKLVEQLTD